MLVLNTLVQCWVEVCKFVGYLSNINIRFCYYICLKCVPTFQTTPYSFEVFKTFHKHLYCILLLFWGCSECSPRIKVCPLINVSLAISILWVLYETCLRMFYSFWIKNQIFCNESINRVHYLLSLCLFYHRYMINYLCDIAFVGE